MPERRRSDESWWDVERASFRAHLAGDTPRAIEILRTFLREKPGSPFVARALGNRAEFLLSAGKSEAARRDLLRALEVETAPTYVRFTLEFALGVLCGDLGERDHAVELLLRALATALEEGKTSTGGAVLRLLDLANLEQLSADGRSLVERSILQSWSLLSLPGQPDLADARRTAEKLLEESSIPR